MDNDPLWLGILLWIFFFWTIFMALYQMFQNNIVVLSLTMIILQLFCMWHLITNMVGRPFGVTESTMFWRDFIRLSPYTIFVIISYSMTFYWWYSIYKETKKTA